MTETQQTFTGELEKGDIDLIRTFHTLTTTIDKLETFTSDHFRMYGLDNFLRGDPKHAIGGFFARMKKNKLTCQVGWERSLKRTNKLRTIRSWKWNHEKVQELLENGR